MFSNRMSVAVSCGFFGFQRRSSSSLREPEGRVVGTGAKVLPFGGIGCGTFAITGETDRNSITNPCVVLSTLLPIVTGGRKLKSCVHSGTHWNYNQANIVSKGGRSF